MRIVLTFLLLLATSALAQEPAWLTPDQVRIVLQARGFTDIEGLERQGNDFVVRQAKRYGTPVRDLRLDAVTGQPREAPLLTEAQAREMLRDRGYTEVTEIGREGDTIHLRAVREGTPTEISIDARTGVVKR
ncbi:hypothetical protein GCM10011504_08610 [Siccirubricoccus deserti]|uniref:PepSY domain-containing protein n=1 Tax=Siccirubricoccus deserti TaxID=2013562 RepID=A0A9X0QV99_9PROT|nr:hypothetical protein [Siccirubricoccus deserti]MBC4014464.1 hypothetical protein [Siccirubricoccus deserti]GGC32672.1 hypothetical protein GCM10011504_08610 [Siccirubricoccus deserti]